MRYNSNVKFIKEKDYIGLFDYKSDEFKAGDKVRVRYREQEGYIIDKNGSLYMVNF